MGGASRTKKYLEPVLFAMKMNTFEGGRGFRKKTEIAMSFVEGEMGSGEGAKLCQRSSVSRNGGDVGQKGASARAWHVF